MIGETIIINTNNYTELERYKNNGLIKAVTYVDGKCYAIGEASIYKWRCSY